MIVLASIFRNATPYLERYFAQIAALREKVDVRLVLGEGDHLPMDNTPLFLRQWAASGDRVVKCDHGGPDLGSVDSPIRWGNIAQVVRRVRDAVDKPGDALVWVEGDLIWEPAAILALAEADRPVTPMVMIQNSPQFYDVWGHRALGQGFLASAPYLPGQLETDGGYRKVDSCGSCFALPAKDFGLFKEWDGMWPFRAGGNLWLDIHALVEHP